MEDVQSLQKKKPCLCSQIPYATYLTARSSSSSGQCGSEIHLVTQSQEQRDEEKQVQRDDGRHQVSHLNIQTSQRTRSCVDPWLRVLRCSVSFVLRSKEAALSRPSQSLFARSYLFIILWYYLKQNQSAINPFSFSMSRNPGFCNISASTLVASLTMSQFFAIMSSPITSQNNFSELFSQRNSQNQPGAVDIAFLIIRSPSLINQSFRQNAFSISFIILTSTGSNKCTFSRDGSRFN